MLGPLANAIKKTTLSLDSVEKILSSHYGIAIYAQRPSDPALLGPMLRSLLSHPNLRGHVLYMTSVPDDPILNGFEWARADRHFIGENAPLRQVFKTLRADILIASVAAPDRIGLVRGPGIQHTVYMPRTVASLHASLTPAGFDFYDNIFCVGPHHAAELKTMEAFYGRPKIMFRGGNGRIDTLSFEATGDRAPDKPKTIVIAPPWGERGFLVAYGERVVRSLLGVGAAPFVPYTPPLDWRVIIRPHAMTRRQDTKTVGALRRVFGTCSYVTFDLGDRGDSALLEADIMLTSWAGVGCEFAFAFERPVLFLDLPFVPRNPDYAAMHLPARDMAVREDLGAICPLRRMADLPMIADELLASRAAYAARIRALKPEMLYNAGGSGLAAADEIMRLFSVRKTTHDADLQKIAARRAFEED